MCGQREDWCRSSPCTNGGTCLSNADGFSCECGSGFTGHTCEEEVRSVSSVISVSTILHHSHPYFIYEVIMKYF